MQAGYKHYEMRDGINNPLPLSNLDEAVEWLTKATSEDWTKRKLIAFVLGINGDIKEGDFRTAYLRAKLPPDLKIGVYGYVQDLGDNKELIERYKPLYSGIYKKHETIFPRLTADLVGSNVDEILHYGETNITCVGFEYAHGKKIESIDLIEPVNDHSDDPTGKRFVDEMLNLHKGRMPAYYVAGMGSPLKVTEDMVYIESQDLRVLTSLIRRAKPASNDSIIREDGYTTHELEVLEKARQKFWVNHDPNKPPKSEIVEAWIIEQGISKRKAQVMDSILRSPEARKGGNKSRS